MDPLLALIIGLLLGAGFVLIGQFTISTGLLGRRQQTPPQNGQPSKSKPPALTQTQQPVGGA